MIPPPANSPKVNANARPSGPKAGGGMTSPQVTIALSQFCAFDPKPLQLLEEAGFRIQQNRLGRRLRNDEIPKMLNDAEAVLAGVEPYEAQVLEGLSRLKCISRCGTGVDSIDLAACRRLNISVLTTPEEVVEPVAQLTVAMILALARNFTLHQNDFRAGFWKKQSGHLLSEWTIGLVGFGRIGQAVERILRPMGPKILVADPKFHPGQLPEQVQLRSLSQLLAQADLVSPHASRAQREGALIGREEFASMKRGARLVNTARGDLVDEAALVKALESGQVSQAAMDVYQTEPYSGPLAKLPQVLLTPHVASLTQASRAAMELRCAQNVVQFFSERSLRRTQNAGAAV